MALNAMGMGYTFTARDLASGVMARLNLKIQQLAHSSKDLEQKYKKATGNIKKGAATAAVGVGLLGGIHKASKAYGDFQFQIVSAAGKMKDGAKYMRDLEKAALEAGKLTQFSPDEAAQGLSELGAQGLSAKQSIEALNPVLNLAAGSLGQLGVADAATVAMASLNAFGKTVDELPQMVDKLTMISDRSAFQMRDFQVAIGQAAAQAKAGQQSFDSMLATLGLLRDAGNEASSAATAYREAVRRVAGDKQALKAMKELGVSSVDQSGAMKDISQIIAELHPKLEKLGVQQRNLALKTIFGVRGMKTYNAVIAGYEKRLASGEAAVGDYASAHKYLTGELDKSSGATKKKVSAALNTVGGKYKLLKGSWQTLVIQIGKLFAEHVAPALTKFINMLNDMIKWLDELSPGWRSFISTLVTFGAVILTIVGTLRVLRGILGIFSLARMAGKYVAGQQAMAAATTSTTAAMQAQNAAANGAPGKLGRVTGAIGRLGRGISAALPYAGMAVAAVGVGQALGNWVVKKLFATEIAALKAEEKWTNFLVSFNRFGRALHKQQSRFSKFNQQLLAHVGALEKAAAASGKAADRVLGKTIMDLGTLAVKRQKILVQMHAAIRAEDTKKALKLQKEYHETQLKMRSIREARIHIQAKQAMKALETETDAQRRFNLSKQVAISQGMKLDDQYARYQKWVDKQKAAIDGIRDAEGRRVATQRFEGEQLMRYSELTDKMTTYLKLMKKLGLAKGKIGMGMDAEKQFQMFMGERVDPAMEKRGLGDYRKMMSTHLFRWVGKEILPKGYLKQAKAGELNPETIRTMVRVREAGYLQRGFSKEGARKEAAFYKWSIENAKRAPWLQHWEGPLGKLQHRQQRAEGRAEFEKLWQAKAAEIGGGEVNINIYGDKLIEDALKVQQKSGARKGARLKVRRRSGSK